jgi:hypothetical protein
MLNPARSWSSILRPLSSGPKAIAWMTMWPLILRADAFIQAIQSANFPKSQKAAQIRFIAKFLACGSDASVRTFDRHLQRSQREQDNW